ncbi:MAG: ABC transporter ATP-binding protein [Planctomycetota bacterium]
MTATPLVALRGIERSFGVGTGRVDALRGIDLEVAEGEYVAILGPSGSGKSTLMQIIGCLDVPTAGSYRYGGKEVHDLSDRELTRLRNEEIGFVFQSFHLLKDRNAIENVRLPLDYRSSDTDGRTPLDPRTVLERVGLGARLTHRPGQLSGGEQQRVAIARALVRSPRLMICDEPTGNLDTERGLEILELLDSIHRDGGATILLVTHDKAVADRAQRVVTLVDGQWAQ